MTRLPGRNQAPDCPPATGPSGVVEHFSARDMAEGGAIVVSRAAGGGWVDGDRHTVIRDPGPTVAGGDVASPGGPTECGTSTIRPSISGSAAAGRGGRGRGRPAPLSFVKFFRFGGRWRRVLDWYTVGTVFGLIWEQVSTALQ